MRFLRNATFVLFVAVGCAVAGLLLSLVAFNMLGGGTTGTTSDMYWYWFPMLLAVGAVIGLVLGTWAGLMLVGRVPIGRFLAETAVGAALGFSVGLAFVIAGEWRFYGAVIGPVLTGAGGSAVAVAHLTWRYHATPKSQPALAD